MSAIGNESSGACLGCSRLHHEACMHQGNICSLCFYSEASLEVSQDYIDTSFLSLGTVENQNGDTVRSRVAIDGIKPTIRPFCISPLVGVVKMSSRADVLKRRVP